MIGLDLCDVIPTNQCCFVSLPVLHNKAVMELHAVISDSKADQQDCQSDYMVRHHRERRRKHVVPPALFIAIKLCIATASYHIWLQCVNFCWLELWAFRPFQPGVEPTADLKTAKTSRPLRNIPTLT